MSAHGRLCASLARPRCDMEAAHASHLLSARQAAVVRHGRDVEEDVAAVDRVAVTVLDDALDGGDHGADVLRRPWLQVRIQAPQQPHVCVELVNEPAQARF